MFTCCPRCKSAHPLNAAHLSRAAGQVRCGQCGHAFNALRHLHDDVPGRKPGTSEAPDNGPPPVLGQGGLAPSIDLAATESPAPARRWPWWLLLAALLLATVFNLAWTFREALLERPGVRDFLVSQGVPGVEPLPPFRDPARIHLVSRDFHAHPTRPGVLVLSATFVNLAAQEQPYPELLVILSDADNRQLATRAFSPAEYLLPGTDPGLPMGAGVHVPLLLEFADPGEQAVGFELRFR